LADEVFVAREQEMARLASWLKRALADEGQVGFVTGEAGSGKTALVTEFARRAQAQHSELLVAVGNCSAQTGLGDPYLPFREVLSLLFGDVEEELQTRAVSAENADRLRAFVAQSGQVLVEVAPDLVGALIPGSKLLAVLGKAVAQKFGWTDKLERRVRHQKEAPTGTAPAVEQQHIFEQYAAVLQTLAARQPLLLIIDDLQWADSASISLLFHLARQLTHSRFLLLGCYRPAEVALGRGAERHPLERVVNELQRYHGDITLDLDRTVAERGHDFVEAFLDTEPNRLGTAFREALLEHTGGHPLFTIELLRDMEERGALFQDAQRQWTEGPALDWDDLPARVESVIAERLARLDAPLREMLTAASVEGATFTAEVLARVVGQEVRTVVRRLGQQLERQHHLVHDSGLQQVDGQRLSRYRFWHSLFQSYLYGQLDPAERAYLHEDVGEALEELYGEHSDLIALQLAWHFEQAGIGPKAIRYLCTAGEQAHAVHAPQEALQLFSRGMDTAERLAVEVPACLLRARGHAYQTLGHFDEADQDYRQALDWAESGSDGEETWRALLDLGRLWASRDYVETGQFFQAALASAQELGDDTAVAHSLNSVGNWHINVGQPNEALQHHQQALDIFSNLKDQRGLAETHDLLGMANYLMGDLAESTAHYEQAVQLFRAMDEPRGLASGLTALMGNFEYLSETAVRDPAAAQRVLAWGQEALAITRELNWPPGEAFVRLSLGLSLGPQGAYAQALEHTREGLCLAEESGHRQWMAGAHTALGALFVDILAPERALPHLQQAQSLAQEIGSLWWLCGASALLASAHVLRGAADKGESALRTVLDAGTPTQTLGHRMAWAAQAEVVLAQGDADQALQIVDKLLATAANRAPGQAIPRLSWLRGRALLALQRLDEADAELSAGLEAARQVQAKPLLWRLHAVRARVHQVSTRPEKAPRDHAAAEAIVAELAGHIPEREVRQQFVERARAIIGLPQGL